MYKNHLFTQNTLKMCNGESCIEVKGKNADIITGAAAIMFVFIGIAAIAEAVR